MAVPLRKVPCACWQTHATPASQLFWLGIAIAHVVHRRAAEGRGVVPYAFPVAAAALLVIFAACDYRWFFSYSPGSDWSSPSEGITFTEAGWWDPADIPLLPLHVAIVVGLAENSDPLGRWLNQLTTM